MDSDTLYWMGLTRIGGLGVRSAHKLITHFGSPKAAYMASLTELEGAGLAASLCQSVFAQAGLKEAEKEIEAAAKAGCRLVNFGDADYPPRLRQIPDPPLVLYVKGEIQALSGHCLAVVGSRRPSAYGLQVARRLARDLAQACGSLGHIAALRRLRVGPFTEQQAIPLDKLRAADDTAPASPDLLLPVATALADIPALALTEAEAVGLRHGQAISLVALMGRIPRTADPNGGLARAMAGSRVVGPCRLGDGLLKPERLL